MSKIVIRLDDPGASTKQFEQYSKIRATVGGRNIPTPQFLQWGPLKRHGPWQGWGQYDELSAHTWMQIFDILRRQNAVMTVAITATWIDETGSALPFADKFPKQTHTLKGAAQEGLIEIANHGLTHCVVEGGKYLPNTWTSNRRYHREFWEWVPAQVHQVHVSKSQELLQRMFEHDVVTFIPPGNVWTEDTERAAASVGIRYLQAADSALPDVPHRHGITFVPESNTFVLHDRDIAQRGTAWLSRTLQNYREFETIRGRMNDP